MNNRFFMFYDNQYMNLSVEDAYKYYGVVLPKDISLETNDINNFMDKHKVKRILTAHANNYKAYDALCKETQKQTQFLSAENKAYREALPETAVRYNVLDDYFSARDKIEIAGDSLLEAVRETGIGMVPYYYPS